MIDNNGMFISASVLKQSFNTRQTCEINPYVLYFIQKATREKKENNGHDGADVKINKHMSNGERFHEKKYRLLRTGIWKNKRDYASFQLLKMKNASKEVMIEPTLFSEDLGLIGEPDVIFFSKDSASILELKNKRSYEMSPLDIIQVEAYIMLFGNQDSKIIRNGYKDPRSIKKYYRKDVKGSIMYNDGTIMRVPLENKDKIESNVSEISENLKICKSISDLPEPTRCNINCVNFYHCEKKGKLYENTPASPGRFEIESPPYLTRA